MDTPLFEILPVDVSLIRDLRANHADPGALWSARGRIVGGGSALGVALARRI